MNKRSLSIIALLLVVFAASTAWGKQRAPVAQFNMCNLDGICDAGESHYVCPEDCPDNYCGDGYCDNYEVQEGGQYYCPQDCNPDPAPDPCASSQTQGPGTQDIFGNPCFPPEEPPEEQPYCGDGNCRGGEEENVCNCPGDCGSEGQGEYRYASQEEAKRCSCEYAFQNAQFMPEDQRPSEECRNIGASSYEFPDRQQGDQGKYCDSNCRVTQCSDGVDNKEYHENNDQNPSYQDGMADKEDLACYCEECWLVGEGSEYDPTKNSEYDACSDTWAQPWSGIAGQELNLTAAADVNWLLQFMAQLIPSKDDKHKIQMCASEGRLAIRKKNQAPLHQMEQGVPIRGADDYEFVTFDRQEKDNGQLSCEGCLQAPAINAVDADKIVDGKIIAQYNEAMKRIQENKQLDAKQKAEAANKLNKDYNDVMAKWNKSAQRQLWKRSEIATSCEEQCNSQQTWQNAGVGGLIPEEAKKLCELQCVCAQASETYSPGEKATMDRKVDTASGQIDGKDDLIADVGECFARCYYDAGWGMPSRGSIAACYQQCGNMFCPVSEATKKGAAANTGGGGGSGRSGGGSGGCYGQFWNGCQYDLCTIMSWYGQSCGFNPPALPNIAGGAGGGGGGGGTTGGTGGGSSAPGGTTTGGGPGGGGGGPAGGGGGGGTTGGGGGSSSRLSGASSSRVSNFSSALSGLSSSFRSSLQSSVRTSFSSGRSSSRSSQSSIPLFTHSSSRSSHRSNSHSSYSSYLQVLACPPDACGANGNAGNTFCAQQGMSCVQSNTIPCIRCMEGPFSSSSYGDVVFNPSSSSIPSFLTSSATSTSFLLCGNGRTDAGEECDDGNLSNFDGCTTACRIIGSNAFSSFASAASSRDLFTLRFCGNGVLNEGEDCDIGAQNSDLPNASCRTDCSISRCGDQIVDTIRGEQCDDGNATPGDGCSNTCALEQLAGNPSSAGVLPGSLIELPYVPGSPNQAGVLPNIPAHGPVGDTGPEAVAIMAAGASAGYTWMKMRRAKK